MSGKTALALVLQTALAIVLLLVGWGLDDLRGFFSNPARLAFVVLGFLGVAVALVLRLDVEMFRKGKRPVGGQRFLLAGVMMLMLILLTFISYADRRGLLTFSDLDWVRYLGLILHAGGGVLLFFALRALGRYYSGYVTLQDDHKLVQEGVYSLIRHPIYLRALLVSVGFPLVFRSLLVFPLFLFTVVFVAARIRQEERLLSERFGSEFEAYRRNTWRLVPFLY